MQVSIENTGSLERRMTVDVPEDRIASEVHNRLQSMRQKTRLDGFRPGKVPLKVIEQRFGARVRAEVVSDVLRTTFYEAAAQEQLRPAGSPSIEPLRSEPGAGLSYTAIFEIYPEVALGPLAELEVGRPEAAVTDADVDKMVETLRKQHSTWERVEREAAMGDRVTIDFKGSVNGEHFAGGEAQGFELELGSGRFIEGFEQGLVGAKAGDRRTVDVTFPEDYRNEDLAGKPASFEVTVQEVAESRLPELDAELFSQFGVTDGGLEAFRAEVRKNMERELEEALRNRSKQRVLDALYAANPLELPKALVESEAQHLLDEMRQNLMRQGASRESLGALEPPMFEDQARRRVALGLLLSECIKQGGLKAEPEKVRARVTALAAGYEDPDAVVRWYYEEPQRLKDFETLVLEDEVIDWVLGQAKVQGEPTTFDDLMNPRQTDSSTPENG
jgi:trigger factor